MNRLIKKYKYKIIFILILFIIICFLYGLLKRKTKEQFITNLQNNYFKNCSDHTPNEVFIHEPDGVKHHHHDTNCLEDDIPLKEISNKDLLTHNDIDGREHHHHLKV